MLIIQAQNSAPLLYTLETIFTRWLKLDWKFEESSRTDVLIEVVGQGGSVSFPNILFQRLEDYGLSSDLVPKTILPVIASFNFLQKDTIEPNLPMLFMTMEGRVEKKCTMENAMTIDFFGGIFFMISRLEEVVCSKTDNHDRFSSENSVAVLNGFIDRPIVDEYVEVLWGILSTKWTFLERVEKRGRTIATCDVDRPLEFPIKVSTLIKQFVKELFDKENRMKAFSNIVRRSYGLFGNFTKDRNLNNIRWMMTENERCGNVVEFNFVAGRTSEKHDPFYNINDKAILGLLNEVDQRGHKIGIHPSYDTYLSPENMRMEVEALREVLNSLNIKQKVDLGRQHFLRWKTPDTIHNWNGAGITYDSTMGFADRAGFRSGTAKQYNWFDLELNKSTLLIERPLVFMECSVLSLRYMNMEYSEETLRYILRLKERALKYGGDFVFLWHDYYFYTEQDYYFYSKIIN